MPPEESKPKHPIDSCLEKVDATASATNRSMVLDLLDTVEAKDGKRSVQIEVSPKIQEQIPRSAYVDHQLEDVPSLIEMVKRYGDINKSVLFVNETGVEFVVDDFVDEGRRQVMGVDFQATNEYVTWRGMTGGAILCHKKLLENLFLYTHTLVSPEVLAKMQDAPVSATVKHESTIAENEKTLGVTFTAKKGEKLVQFPKQFDITVPAFDTDRTDASIWLKSPVNLSVILPDQADSPAMFRLLSPDLTMKMRLRIENEIKMMREKLSGFLVVQGRCKYRDRTGEVYVGANRVTGR